MRYGIRTNLKRRWTPMGYRPTLPVRIGYINHYLYTALNPVNGDLFCLLLPRMDNACFEIFLQEFDEHCQDKKIKLFLDKAPCHQAYLIKNPAKITMQFLPTACPELNPVERFFKELRKYLANKTLKTLEEIEVILIAVLNTYWQNPNLVVKLAYYPYMNTTS